VEAFVEKPSPQDLFDLLTSSTRQLEVSLGIYAFRRSVLEAMLEGDVTREIGSIGDDIVTPAVESGLRMTTFKHDGSFTVRLQ
jgi:ADP-glucose pyrophosphorylase